MLLYKMDCQQLIVYGFILAIVLYVLNNVCGFNSEGFSSIDLNNVSNNVDPSVVYASEEQLSKNQSNLNVTGSLNTSGGLTCGLQQQLKPADLLPEEQKNNIQQFNVEHPTGEGILKGVNFLDAGYHVGVNTIGQSLRNANLNLRAEPPNPRVAVSPWQNSTIDPDLSRLALDDDFVCNA